MSDSNAGRGSYDTSLRDEIEARPSTVAVSALSFILHALTMPVLTLWYVLKATWIVGGILFDTVKIYVPTLIKAPYFAYRGAMLGHKKDMMIYVTRQMTKHLLTKAFKR